MMDGISNGRELFPCHFIRTDIKFVPASFATTNKGIVPFPPSDNLEGSGELRCLLILLDRFLFSRQGLFGVQGIVGKMAEDFLTISVTDVPGRPLSRGVDKVRGFGVDAPDENEPELQFLNRDAD